MGDFQVRRAEPADIKTITAFNLNMALETEGLNLDAAILHAGVTNVFENPEHGYYIVCEKDNTPVACMMITFEWSDWRNGQFWWIQSVYVHKTFRRQGVFKKMYEHVRSEALAESLCAGLRLYVEQENRTAKRTYEHLGMTKTHYHLYEYTKTK